MVIEHLTFEVPLSSQAAFLYWDDRIWTAALMTQPGYLGKEIWRDRKSPQCLQFIIRWESWEAWQQLDPYWLSALDQRFQAVMKSQHCHYRLIESQGLDPIALTPEIV